ncbi:MAG TPA: hypothetical protein VGD69_30495 [Herpetosiphonaceae bacterium]
METTTTFDLDAAIADAVADYQQIVATHTVQRQAEQEAREQQEQQRQAAQIATCAAQLRQDLGDDLYEALAIAVRWVGNRPQATALIDGAPWTISATTAPAPKFWAITRPIGLGGDCTREHLRAVLLRCIGQERELRAERQANEERQDAERQARRAEHARCQAQLDAALAIARAALWTWPAGQILTLYRWSWHIGDSTFEAGWSVSDRLDAQGYATVYTEATLQTLRLDMFAHQPVVERRTFHATDALPGELREQVRIDVPGIWWSFSDEQYIADPEAVLTHDVGQVPIAWVQTQFTAESPT